MLAVLLFTRERTFKTSCVLSSILSSVLGAKSFHFFFFNFFEGRPFFQKGGNNFDRVLGALLQEKHFRETRLAQWLGIGAVAR